VGIDLPPVALRADFPANVEYRVANVLERWSSFTDASADYVHTRTLSFGITNWAHVVGEAFRVLKPGGWLELQEFSFPTGCDDGSLVPETALYKWNDAMIAALSGFGIDIRRDVFQHDARMKSAGFENVEFRDLRTPFEAWMYSQGEKWEVLGELSVQNLGQQVVASRKSLMGTGWGEKELDEMAKAIPEEIAGGKLEAYVPLGVY
jgi:SAM-dependent methyltransferase